MIGLIVFITAMIILFYVLKYEAEWFRFRVELTLAMFGIDYRPNKHISFCLVIVIFYFIYSVILRR